MEVNKNKVRQLRQRRGWSQQHLADACGISLRTVQRLEKYGNVSRESVSSVCAVFELQKEDICVTPTRVEDRLNSAIQPKKKYALLAMTLLFGVTLGFLMGYFMR